MVFCKIYNYSNCKYIRLVNSLYYFSVITYSFILSNYCLINVCVICRSNKRSKTIISIHESFMFYHFHQLALILYISKESKLLMLSHIYVFDRVQDTYAFKRTL